MVPAVGSSGSGPPKRRRTGQASASGTQTLYKAYKVRMQPTREQRQALKGWFNAARWGYNAMVDAVNKEQLEPRLEACKVLMHDPRIPAEVKAVNNRIYRQGMLEAISAFKANETVKRKKAGNHQYQIKMKKASDLQQTVTLEGASRLKSGKIENTSPVLRIVPCESSPLTESSRRRHADLYLGTTMRPHGPIRLVDRKWLVEKLVQDRYLMHEGKILWNKRLN